jgi:hypothetical protein
MAGFGQRFVGLVVGKYALPYNDFIECPREVRGEE